jgi:6,7-dimethyl-8-ribityllumazine synthase
MSSAHQNLSAYDPNSVPSGKGRSFGIVVAEWNNEITSKLLDGVIQTLLQYNVSKKDIVVKYVPGTFELVYAAKSIAKSNHLSAVICLGCVIKGETKHDEYISMSVANGLQQLNVIYDIPFIFGVLTPNSMQQAIDRAGGVHGNKGVEAAITALKMVGI